MKKGITSILAATVLFSVAVSTPLRADTFFSRFCSDSCTPCEAACTPCDTVNIHPRDCDPCTLFKKSNGCRKKSVLDKIEVYGWIQGGVYTNSRGCTTTRQDQQNYKGRTVSGMNGSSGNSNLLSTVQTTDFQVNQLWIGAKKEADGRHGLDWGFAAEVFFGPEAWFAQSWSDAKFDYGWQDGDYFTAIPQLYFQLACEDLSVKIGKYETVAGYEAFRAPQAFFYSHTHIFMMEPYSHTGALFEYTPNDKLYVAAGYTTGGDASFENKYDDHGFLGYVSYRFSPKLSASYCLHVSRYGDRDLYPNGDLRWFAGNDVFFHTLAFSYDFTGRLNYSFQWNFGDAKDRDAKTHRNMTGIANTLTYRINNHWSVGFRAEWAKDDDSKNPNDKYGGLGYLDYYLGEVQAYTLGLNWKPYSNLSVRPEVRYDHCRRRVFNYGRNKDQFSGGICAVVSF